MLKKLRRLRPKVGLLTDFYVFDTETGTKKNGKYGQGIYWELKPRPECFQVGVIYGHNFCKVIHSVEEFKQELLHERYKKKKVFAHNLEYDLNVLYGNILEMDPTAIFNGKLICATNGNCMFADSGNIFTQTSVEKLGKMIGILKPELGEGDTMFSATVDAGVINRCTVDCEIVYEALFQIFEDCGDIKITQASLSMTYFRRFHQPYDIDHNENTKFFWDSYYGGRCEALKIGLTHACGVDVKSMYPWAMRETVFPNPKTLQYIINPNVKVLNRYLDNYEGCVYCTVLHADHFVGFLPYKMYGKLCFPTGRFSGCWNFNELRFALSHGVIKIEKITKLVFGYRMPSPFESYVNKNFEKRIQAQRRGDEFESYRIKIFMNSLYGKFAQRILAEEIYIKDIELQQHVIDEYQRKGLLLKISMFNMERKDAMITLKSTKFQNISYSIPSFASYITSTARVHLLAKLISMKHLSPVYMDTDSIFYEIEGDIETGNGLGNWERDDKIITDVRGLKNYKYISGGKEYRKIKGVPAKATKISDNDFEYYNLIRTKEGIRRNIIPGTMTKRTKHINNVYTKRIVNENGTTKPIHIC